MGILLEPFSFHRTTGFRFFHTFPPPVRSPQPLAPAPNSAYAVFAIVEVSSQGHAVWGFKHESDKATISREFRGYRSGAGCLAPIAGGFRHGYRND